MSNIIRKLRKLEEKIEELKKEGELAVFITNKPVGKVVGQFDDYKKAKEKAVEVAQKLKIKDLTWLDELKDEPMRPPFYVVVDAVEPPKLEIAEVEEL